MSYGIEALAATTIATGAAVLGWRGKLLLLWVGAMLMDYITGTAAAIKRGEWTSTRAREGLWHKGAMLAVVAVAVLLDLLVRMGQDAGLFHLETAYRAVLMPTVMAWYTVTELGSSVENASRMGAALPRPLLDALDAARRAIQGEDKDQP